MTAEFNTVFDAIQDINLASQKKHLKEKYKNQSPPPDFVDLNILKDYHFKIFILLLKDAHGQIPSFNNVKSKRSGFKYFWALKGINAPEDTLSRFMAGYKRQEIKRNADAGLTTDNAKEPLNFNCYKILARAFMKGKPDDCYLWTFAHTYFLLQWNSLSRNETMQKLSLTKIKWADDALQLYFIKMKNDQNGTQSVKPKHIYANPFTPEICPILSLGIYFSVTRFDPSCNLLFPGSGQDQRYSRAFDVLLKGNDDQTAVLKANLKTHGFQEDKFGTHAFRKGVTTYLSTGCAAPPSQASIDIRGGWAQGGVRDAYHHYSAPGDQYVGRVACGLPCLSTDFAVLPPHFVNFPNPEALLEYVKIVFPTLPEGNTQVGLFCLASLIFHWDWLRNNLPPDHILFNSILFTNYDIYNQLNSYVVAGQHTDQSEMRLTGVSQEIFLLKAVVVNILYFR